MQKCPTGAERAPKQDWPSLWHAVSESVLLWAIGKKGDMTSHWTGIGHSQIKR